MNTLLNLPDSVLEPQEVSPPPPEPERPQTAAAGRQWSEARFAQEQIHSLVRQVFLPGWPKPARHVVFSAVEETTYVAEICVEVGKALAAEVASSVCVAEANPHNQELENIFWRNDRGPSAEDDGYGSLRNASQQLTENLWLAPLRALHGKDPEAASSACLGRRLSDFRLEFEYSILHGPPVGLYAEAALLGHLSDGVVLVLQANSTRRIAAQRAKETLLAANARMLGAVLSERTFPIPEGIYRKL